MKTYLLPIITGILFFAACSSPEKNAEEAEVNDLKWMNGNWVTKKNNQKISERWQQVSSQSLNGTQYTIEDKDTVAIQAMEVSKKAGRVYYTLTKGPNAKPIEYKLTKMEDDKAVFKNPELDFPSEIVYYKDQDHLVSQAKGQRNGEEQMKELVMHKQE